MPLNLPYCTSPGRLIPALDKIKEVPTPAKVTQDFIKTKLGFSGGTGNSLLSYLRKIGFVSEDGSPTEMYKRFRNPDESNYALADAFRFGYSELYNFNEYLHDLDDKKIEGLIMQHAGYEKGARPLELIMSCITKLKGLSDFNKKEATPSSSEIVPIMETQGSKHFTDTKPPKNIGMNLSYTINLNLPATNDISVYNAIFKSLKENLLYDEK